MNSFSPFSRLRVSSQLKIITSILFLIASIHIQAFLQSQVRKHVQSLFLVGADTGLHCTCPYHLSQFYYFVLNWCNFKLLMVTLISYKLYHHSSLLALVYDLTKFYAGCRLPNATLLLSPCLAWAIKRIIHEAHQWLYLESFFSYHY